MLLYTEKIVITKKVLSTQIFYDVNISYLDHNVLPHTCYSKHLNSLHKQKLDSSEARITHTPCGIYNYHR